MYPSRERAAALGQDTVRILQAGHYALETGAQVDIVDHIERSVRGTVSYPPDHSLPESFPTGGATLMEVKNETTLAAARRLVLSGLRPAVLNFASAKHPGGGFLSGARAQEESLCRSSGLYACLHGNAMYDFHLQQPDAMYSHYAIYAPDVPVFRQDDGALLPEPYLCSFITCPAVNANVVLQRNRHRRPEIRTAMHARIARVLAIGATHRHEALVLGAWGCGVFGNDATEIAELFHETLSGAFRGVFARVTFAILDTSQERRFIGPFHKAFGTVGAD
jgi:uncharacterized protein (TIGR02452 family)